jgi:CheY-like chemotaxis protein
VGEAPIIAVIGGDAAEEAGECLSAGADAVMRKPVSVAAVARAIAEAGASRKQAAA